MSEKQHTSTPYHYVRRGRNYRISSGGRAVCQIDGSDALAPRNPEEIERSARFITTACNCYEDLIKRTQQLESTFRHYFINDPNNADRCKECGLDLRDPIHIRQERA